MSGYEKGSSFWQFLPPEPTKWLWTRLKLYVAILAAAVAGFFFIAGWYVAPIDGHVSRMSSLFEWFGDFMSLVVLVVTLRAAHRARRGLENVGKTRETVE
jgi:hypothetical protein